MTYQIKYQIIENEIRKQKKREGEERKKEYPGKFFSRFTRLKPTTSNIEYRDRDETFSRRTDDARPTFIGIFMAARCTRRIFIDPSCWRTVDARLPRSLRRRKSRYLFISPGQKARADRAHNKTRVLLGRLSLLPIHRDDVDSRNARILAHFYPPLPSFSFTFEIVSGSISKFFRFGILRRSD